MPETRPRVRASRGLTTRGRCLLAGGLAAGVCAFLLDERDLLRIGVLAVALPLIVLLVTATRRPRLAATHQVLPDRISPGTVGQVTLTVTNVGTGRSGTVEIAEAPIADLTAGMRCLLPSLRRGRSAMATYRLFATRRGRFELGPPLVRFTDPFALWEDVRPIEATAEVLVVPSPVALTGLPTGSGNRSAASGRATVGSVGGDPDAMIRDYRNGDDIRTIHWRASARHDSLMVRLQEPVSHGGAMVMVDNRAAAHRGVGAASSLETAVTLVASISLHLLTTDHEVRLTTHRGQLIAHGHDIADDVLAGLAVLEPDDNQQARLPAVGSAGTVIAVLGRTTREDIGRLVGARPPGVQAIALLLDVDTWHASDDPGLSAAAARNLLSGGGWRTVVVGRGDDLADAWRQACRAGDGYAVLRSGSPGPTAVAGS